MRKSYSVDNSGIMGIIKTYLEDFTDLYILKSEDSVNTVYHVNNHDIDMVFTKANYSGKRLVMCFLVKSFPEGAVGVQWCKNADNMVKWVGDTVQHDMIPGVGYSVALPIYYPCAFLDETDVKTIYFDYNSKNNTIMISVERSYEYHIVGVDNPSYKYGSESIIISDSEKYLDFEGGFFIGGNCGCFELVAHKDLRYAPILQNFRITDYLIADSHANCAKFHVIPPPRCFRGLWTYPWSDDPYRNNHCRLMNGSNIPNIKNYHAFDIIMYGKIDNAPYRNRGEVAVDLSQENVPKTQPAFSYTVDDWGKPLFIVNDIIDNGVDGIINMARYADWCTSCQPYPLPQDSWTDSSEGRLGYFYPILVPSITNSDIKVPRYEPLLSNNFLENSHNVNTLNDITTVMPLYMMVRRDPPEEVLSYSAVCRNDVINMVNMRYMSPSNIKNGIYPIKEKTYSCYNIGTRRNLSGFMGYQGLAFEQEQEEEQESDV